MSMTVPPRDPGGARLFENPSLAHKGQNAAQASWFALAWSWVKRARTARGSDPAPHAQGATTASARARAELAALRLPITPAGFMSAARANDLHACELFLSAGMAVDEVFDKAARDGCTPVVRALLAHQPSPQALGNALIWAAHGNHHELVELLVGRVDLHKYGSEALWWAAHCNHWRVLECLLGAMVAAKARVSADDPWVAMVLEKTLAPTHQGLLPRLLALGVERGGG